MRKRNVEESLTAAEFTEFLAEIGYRFFHSPIMAKQLGHSHPISTVRDYTRVMKGWPKHKRLAYEFIVDFFETNKEKGGTEKLLAKWYPNGYEAPGEWMADLVNGK